MNALQDESTTREVDAAFARFCATGSPEDLGFVFDTVSQRVLLVAERLVGDRQRAEDLLQQTFLELMRGAPRFRAGSPLMPWLWTILARRAATVRGRSRRAGVALEGHEISDGGPDPAEVAAARDEVEHVAAAIERLPGTYRQVVAMRVLHGMRPVDIANVLDRPLGTVHAQCARGLERLKRDLPAGAVLLIGIDDGRGLAAVREAVVTAVPRESVAAATVSASLVTLMSSKWSVAVGISCIAALAFVLAWKSPGRADALPDAFDAAPESASVAQFPTAIEPLPAKRQSILDAAAGHTREPSEIRLIGRVVSDVESRRPIPGASVAVWSRLPGSVGSIADVEAIAGGVCSSDADGFFELRVTEPSARCLVVAAPGQAPLFGAFSFSEVLKGDGATGDFGTLVLREATEVWFEVVDGRGEPVAEHRLSSSSLLGMLGAGSMPPVQIRSDAERQLRVATRSLYRFALETDAGGRAGPIRLLVGERFQVYADARRGPMGVRSEGAIVVEPAPSMTVRVQLQAEDPQWSIRGAVVDESGAPRAGIRFDVVTDSGQKLAEVESRRDGVIWVNRQVGSVANSKAEYEAEQRIRLVPADPSRFRVVAPQGVLTVPVQDLRVVVHEMSPASAELVVRDAAGQPVESFGWACIRKGDRSPHSLESVDRHEGGVARVEGFAVGDAYVVVRDREGRFGSREVRLREGSTHPVEVTVREDAKFAVRVVDDRGVPIADAAVICRTALGAAIKPTTRSVSSYSQSQPSVLRFSLGSEIVRKAKTDARGIAPVSIPWIADEFAVGLLADAGGGTVCDVQQVPGVVDCIVEMPASRPARITGRIQPADLVSRWQAAAGGGEPASEVRLDLALGSLRRSIQLKADGSFDSGPLRAGAWRVGARITESVSGATRVVSAIAEPIAVQGGELLEDVVLDVGSLLPGSLSGRVVGDRSAQVAWSRLRLVSTSDEYRMWGAQIDGDGRFETRLPAGRWVVWCDASKTDGGEVVIDANRITGLTIDVSVATATVTLLDSSDAPIRDRLVSLAVRPSEFEGALPSQTTDGSGRAVFSHAPARDVLVCVWPEGTTRSFGRFRAPAGGAAPRPAVFGPFPCGDVEVRLVE